MVARIAGRTTDDLPWLKFEVIAQTGNGLLYGVTHVQRINTQGGLVRGPCEQAGAITAPRIRPTTSSRARRRA